MNLNNEYNSANARNEFPKIKQQMPEYDEQWKEIAEQRFQGGFIR